MAGLRGRVNKRWWHCVGEGRQCRTGFCFVYISPYVLWFLVWGYLGNCASPARLKSGIDQRCVQAGGVMQPAEECGACASFSVKRASLSGERRRPLGTIEGDGSLFKLTAEDTGRHLLARAERAAPVFLQDWRIDGIPGTVIRARNRNRPQAHNQRATRTATNKGTTAACTWRRTRGIERRQIWSEMASESTYNAMVSYAPATGNCTHRSTLHRGLDFTR